MMSHLIFERRKELKKSIKRICARLQQLKPQVSGLKLVLELFHANKFNEARDKLVRINSLEYVDDNEWQSFRLEMRTDILDDGIGAIIVNLAQDIHAIITNTSTIGHVMTRLPNDVYPLFMKDGLVIVTFENIIMALDLLGSMIAEIVSYGKKVNVIMVNISILDHECDKKLVEIYRALSGIDLPLQHFIINQIIHMFQHIEKISESIMEIAGKLKILNNKLRKR
jgi:uncharacterized protein Yka (UPF0111/DUF47 family)